MKFSFRLRLHCNYMNVTLELRLRLALVNIHCKVYPLFFYDQRAFHDSLVDAQDVLADESDEEDLDAA